MIHTLRNRDSNDDVGSQVYELRQSCQRQINDYHGILITHQREYCHPIVYPKGFRNARSGIQPHGHYD